MPRQKRLTPPKRQRKETTISDIPDDLWHEIRGILNERRRRGRIEYLVDWEPNAVTGQTHTPSWQHGVTQDALNEWEAKKADFGCSPSLPSSGAPETEPESQESQPPRPANWRSLERSAAAQINKRKCSGTEEGLEAPRKKQRLERASSPSDGSTPTITTASSAVSPSGSPQSYQPLHAIDDGSKRVAIVLEKNPDFDPTDFHSVAGINTQSTAFSSQAISQLESQDTQLIITNDSQNSRQTVPDSQDLLESSLSLPPPIPPQSATQRVIADSQSESQLLPDSHPTAARLDTAEQAQPPAVSTGEDTQIPSGQRPTQSDESSYGRLRDSLGTRQSDDLVITYSSQPPFTPFPESLPSAGHLATETPSQTAGLSLLRDLNPEDLPLPGRQDHISSQLSQAAQLTRGGPDPSFDREPSTQGSLYKSRPSAAAASSTSELFHQAQKKTVQSISGQVLGEIAAQPTSSATMDGTTGPHGPSPRPSAEEELNKILDLSAAGPSSDRPSAQEELDKIFTFHVDPSPPVPEPRDALREGALSDQVFGGDEPIPFAQAEVTIQSQPRTVEDLTVPSQNQGLGLVAESLPESHETPSSAPSVTGFSSTLRADLAADALPGTISPADILRSADGNEGEPLSTLGQGSFHSAVEFDSSRLPPPMGQTDQEVDHVTPDGSLADRETRDELITLSFQASARDEYMSRLVSYREAIQKYSRHFDEDDTEEPAESLVGQIDDLFRTLQNICDFPPDLVGTSLEELDAKGKTKYARDSNGKFSFIYELLQGITVDTKVCIVARSPELLRLISYVTETLEIECVCEALEMHDSAFKESAVVVRLALPSEHLPMSDFDVIIGFDNSLANSTLLTRQETSTTKASLILRLVTTHGLDHIDSKVDHDIVPLERRQAILYAIVGGRHLVSDPERGQQEPHEIAKAFYDYLNGEVEDPDWVPVPLPDDLLMSYLGSQGQPAIPATNPAELDKGLKRKYGDEDDEEAKRLKTTQELDISLSNQDPPIPDEVLNMLDMISPGDEVLASRPTTVSIHLVMLELLAQQFTELGRQKNSAQLDEASRALIESQASQLKSYKRSQDNIYKKYRAALSDRLKYEKTMNESEQKLRDAEKKAERNTEKLEQRIAALEADKARLLNANESTKGAETPLAANERFLKEAQEKVKVLEKRLVNAREESEYIRDQYRNAQSAASETGQLRTQLKKAEEEAAKNKVRIHEINVANSVRGYLSRISELETQLKEREVELDRAREELRVSKNGRRETRQTSVPRSPRMGMLSPRAPARSYPSSTSRGGSPAPIGIDVGNVAGGSLLPGMQLLPQTPANGRWNQL